tara:strand:+ start:17664 stop:19130 length:1467 start_codon:yes stop_codon:yes gene_type:complete
MSEKAIMHFIDGAYTEGTSNVKYQNISPVDGSVICDVYEGKKPEVDAAVKAAKAALKGPWGKMTLEQRVAILYKVADGIVARFDDFLNAECLDTGKPKSLASHIDIPRGAANFKVFADVVKNVAGESFVMSTPDGTGAVNYSIRAPKGVIAVISPWNLPLLLMTWKVGPALACGNTVVVKPSEETPMTTSLLGEVMNDAGVPPGVFNVVNGFGPDSAGAYLTEHPDVDGITFTGETRTGSAIMKAASEGMRDVSMEMGGKNPAIVFADCNLDKAIEGVMRSAFLNCGQVCLGTERVFVERPIFDEFVVRLKEGVEGLKLGAPDDEGVNFGPLISKEHQGKVLKYYNLAKELGANVVVGGGVPEMREKYKGGTWIEPTIWTGLDDDSPIMREEIFGPCCHISPFDDEDEVIERANDTVYGLTSSVWTESITKGHRVAAQIESGVVWVNSWFLRDLRTAFGGAKQSGIGREGGVHSLEFYTEMRNICVKL